MQSDLAVPWWVTVIWIVFPWVFVGPLWGLFLSRQTRRPRLAEGRRAFDDLPVHSTPERGRVTWMRYTSDPRHSLRRIDVHLVVEAPGGDVVFVDARARRRPHDAEIHRGAPVWIWRAANGWVFGQIADHGLDPTWTPPPDPPFPTFDDLHGGRRPEWFVTELEKLAQRYRSGEITLEECQELQWRLFDGPWD